jgi:hypothetical protein
MKRLLFVLCVLAGVTVAGQTNLPSLYIAPTDDGFETYLAAAMHKKEVPIRVMANPDGANYTMKTSQIAVTKESTGGKVARCIFASCSGIEDKASTSVTLVSDAGEVVWSYSVNKGRGQKNRQSLAEAIAKHLKDDYLQKKK